MTWISCKEKLPNERGRYLVSRVLTSTVSIVDVLRFATDLYEVSEFEFVDKKGISGWYDFDSEWGYYCIDDGSITAWMELPEPYEEDANANS